MMHRSLSLFLLCATACVVWCSASTGNSGEGSHRIAVQNYIDLQRESLSLSGASQGAKTAEESVEHNNPQDQLRELKNTEFPNKDEVIPKLEVTKPPSLLLSAFLWLQELIAMVTDKKSDPEALTRGQKKDPLSTLVGSFCVGLALVVWIYYRVLRHNKRKLRNQDEIHKPAAPLGGPLLPVDADGASWRLHCGPGGRHTWHVEETEASPQVKQLREQFSRNRGKQLHPADLVWRSARTSTGSSASPAAAAFTTSEDAAAALEAALGKACAELRALQSEDGHWPCDYAGPHFLTPGYVFAAAIAGHEIPELERRELRRFLCNSQNADGGWPMHIEGPSTMFGTALNYPALRLLGASSSDPFVERGRAWLQAHGGALGVPSWGKLWLATIGCFEWEGLQPVPPELWSLPKWVPVHPNNLWCHARMVYLPMAYLYATKPSYPERLTDIVRQLRQEMFSTDYDKINWHAARWQLCPTDSFRPPSKLLALTHRFAAAWEAVVPNSVRRRALAAVLEAIRHEDEVTDFICLGPVNKMLNLVVRHLVHDDDVRERHWDRTRDYLWVSEDGMKCNGYNGCQVWDVAFAAQALMECSPAPNSELHDNVASTTVAALRFLDEAQVTSEVPRGDEFFRGAAAGGWGFSTRDQTWVVSDCTAEAMLGCLAAHTNPRIPSEASLSPARLAMGADILLHWQNADGGWGTLESKRGPNWLELLNPSEVFGDIMVDYSHVECTSSVIRALTHFEAEFPELAASRADAIRQAVSRGVEHLRQRQNVDGSWKGFWAICYTYGTWFAVEGLRAAGAAEDDPAVEAACRFLLSKQNRDGGWGEDYSSCAVSRYVSCESQVVMTAWAVLTLLRGSPRYAKGTAVRHGIRYLLAAQLDNGDWPQERVSGSFNGNCTISYTNFRTIFPLWALARAHSMNTLPVLSSDPPLSDAIVVGGGPAGCASAVALARQGYRVTVIERDMRRPDRIIGELLQPGGVRALKDLGLEDVLNDDRFPVVNGYVVRLGHDEIPLAYPDAHVARSFHHGDFIQRLRAAAAAVPGVTFTEGTVAGLVLDDGAVTGVRFSPKHSETPCELRAPLTVVADGSFSNLRRVAGIPPASTTSRFAGLVLKAQPPSAGYAFVCLCDPSPALCYPISPTELRLLVDLPHSAADMIKASGGTEAYIREFIVPQLPTDLQDPALEALSESSRIAQCQYLAPAPTTPPPGCWVIGDALSMRHPLTGGGMTVAFTDAVAMAQALEHGGTPRLGDTQAMDAVMRWWRQQRAATAGCINTLAQSLYGVARASKQDKSVAARELQAGMFAYFLQGPRCTSTPLRLLAGLENRRVLLLAHFFAVALVSSARAMRHSVMAPFQTFAHACAIIRPYAMELRMR